MMDTTTYLVPIIHLYAICPTQTYTFKLYNVQVILIFLSFFGFILLVFFFPPNNEIIPKSPIVHSTIFQIPVMVSVFHQKC